jgi:hypothetical protein
VGTGVYILTCTWAARALGASEADAAAISVLTHLATVLANLTVGAVSAIFHRRELREFLALRRGRGLPENDPGPLSPVAPAKTFPSAR